MRNDASEWQAVALCVAAASLLLLGGCVERTLIIRSDPPGANLIVNGDPHGVAPVEIPFETYGIFEVVASLPRHQRLQTAVPVKAPWYEQIPIDFFVENIWPFTVTDRHEVILSLEPTLPADDAGIGRREEQLRERMQEPVGK